MADDALRGEMLKAEVESGLSALKGSQVINGGASAALLAVLAEGLKSPAMQTGGSMTLLSVGWLCFMFGLLSATAGMASRYLSQAPFTAAHDSPTGAERTRLYNVGQRWRITAIAAAAVSLLAFAAGGAFVFAAVMLRS
jgi:hypothetical protein